MKIIEVVAHQGHLDTVTSIVGPPRAVDVWHGPVGEDGRLAVRVLVESERVQEVLDALQGILGASDGHRIVVSPVEASLPAAPAGPDVGEAGGGGASREELYEGIHKSARLDGTYLLLVALSTVVASVGLMKDNVAVVIGAMVIAPLLGPNLAMALGTALGDAALMWRALRCGLTGLALAAAIAALVGVLWPVDMGSAELLQRTVVGLDSVALALASGAAAVLSLTTGVSSVLVGVMVAVALLPPTATMGLMLGAGQPALALGAALLLAVNVVCVNLAAKLVFLARGVRPRTWIEQERARQSVRLYAAIWVLSLGFLVAVIVYGPVVGGG